MIFVKRLQKPRVLRANAQAWKNVLLAATTAKEKTDAEKRYRHREIKSTLITMFHGKCAYCESKIVHVDYGHIEHYRPKRGAAARPDLTFAWPNLLLACGVCNGAENKGDKFPNKRDGGPIINPCKDTPEDEFVFIFDGNTKLASVYGTTSRGKTTERLLGLNRNELREYRSQILVMLAFIAANAATDPEAAAILAQAKLPEAPYSAFARCF